jgi:putative ABC transport system ATP-binding protein
VVAIRARGVNHAFGEGESRTQVLFENGLDIGRGEIVILTGPSGSGKTTLLTLIGALRQLQEGSLVVLDRQLRDLRPADRIGLRREIGFIFQHHNLFSSLTALENVRMATALKSGGSDTAARDLLGALGLGDRMHYLPSRLSGGQRQRVAIARALANQPALVLADEPTAALDAQSSQIVMDLLHQLVTGPTQSTVLIVTHDQRLLDRAHRIVNMVAGRIVSNVVADQSVRICRLLRQIPDLRDFEVSALARLADHMTVQRYPAGKVIAVQGAEGSRWYVVSEGTCEVLQDGRVVRQIGSGAVFGEMTPITHERIHETVRTRTEVELYELSGEDLETMLTADKLESQIKQHLMSRQS